MGKTADLAMIQKTIIDTLHKEDKSQRVITERGGFSRSAVSKHIKCKVDWKEETGYKKLAYSVYREDRLCLKSSVKFPQSVIWAAMASAGVGPLCFLKSTVNAVIYQDILEHFMLPSADKLYGDADFIFQQDLPTLPKVPKAGTMTMMLLCVHTTAGENVKMCNAVERSVDALTLLRRSNACHVFKGAAKQTSTLILCRLTTSRVYVNFIKYFKCESKKLIDGNLTIKLLCLLMK